MFKMGGSSGTGITSGLDRQNYQLGSRPNIRQISGPDRPRFQIPRVGGGADARGRGGDGGRRTRGAQRRVCWRADVHARCGAGGGNAGEPKTQTAALRTHPRLRR